MKNTPPMCSECKHYHLPKKGEPLCARKGVIHRKDHSTGITNPVFAFCQAAYDERNPILILPWGCGPRGRHFTPIEVTVHE
jgi:hypothetical protein